jgi:putative inorganic carbon (hco3(-)) transporter
MFSRTGTDQLTGHPVLDREFARRASAFKHKPQHALLSVESQEYGESALSAVAYSFLLGFLFVATSRVLDFTLPTLHLPLILAVLSAVLALISNGVRSAFATSTGRFIGLFTLWFILCVPFSQWKGGSFVVLKEDISRSFLVFMMVATTMNTVRRVVGAIAVIGLGTVITMSIALVQNHRLDGRLTMFVGQYSNSNDLAQIMLLGMCFIPSLGAWLRNKTFTWFGYCMMIPFLYAIILTGSRAALLTTAMLAVIVLFFASPGKKLFLVVALPLLGIGLLALSGTARMRMASLFTQNTVSSATSVSEGIAIASAEGRLTMLKDSLKLTLQNPLFGVGPGVFQSASASLQNLEGKRAMWLEAHNSYTQVSSETGIPGAFFYGAAVFTGIGGLMRLRKRTLVRAEFRDMHIVVNSLLLGFVTFVLTSVFSSVAYNFIFWMLFGLVAATITVVHRAVERALAVSAQPVAHRVKPISVPVAAPAPPLQPAIRVTLSGRIKPKRSLPSGGPGQSRG